MRCAGVRGYIIGLHKDIYGCGTVSQSLGTGIGDWGLAWTRV